MRSLKLIQIRPPTFFLLIPDLPLWESIGRLLFILFPTIGLRSMKIHARFAPSGRSLGALDSFLA